MIDWNALLDHLIQAAVTIIVAAIPAYFAFRLAFHKIDINTSETVKAKNAAVQASRQGAENADSIAAVQKTVESKVAVVPDPIHVVVKKDGE